MEATATYDFTASADDELSFVKGQVLKVLSTKDEHWYKAECEGQEGHIPKNYVRYKPASWFSTEISREQAETTLKDKINGAFIVRSSDSSPADFSLSVKSDSHVQHFKVLRDGAGKYFLWLVKFSSLNEMVNYHKTASVSRGEEIMLKEEADSPQYRANFDFVAKEEGELDLKREDIISFVEKVDTNWWCGQVTRDSVVYRGLFPSNYVSEYSG